MTSNFPSTTGPILVLDDDPDISMLLKLMLEFKNYSVIISEKAEETLSILERNNVSLVIIDMFLSGISGIDICLLIRKNAKKADCPVLMFSAHPNAREICLKAGADDFISKPFDMNDILSKVNNLLKKGVVNDEL